MIVTMEERLLRILDAVAFAWGQTRRAIIFGGRSRELAYPRQAAMLLARWEDIPDKVIAWRLRRDHSTVSVGAKRAAARAEGDERFGDRLLVAYIVRMVIDDWIRVHGGPPNRQQIVSMVCPSHRSPTRESRGIGATK